MKTKTYIILLPFLILTLFFASCDLERLPNSQYTEELINKDQEAAFDYMLNGAYALLKAWADPIHRVGEYPGDNVMIRKYSSDSFYAFINYEHKPESDRLSQIWFNSYKAITQASEVIKLGKEGESEILDQQIGEAYFMRGMLYFYLVNTFGRPYSQSPETNLGVPILLGGAPGSVSEIENPDRSTVKQVYEQVIKDLEKAESLMTIKKSSIYATKEATQALLCRVYLYMSGTYENANKEYAQKALDYAKLVEGTNRFELLPTETFKTYNEMMPDNQGQTEAIFAVKRIASELTVSWHRNSVGGLYSTINGDGWGEMYASAKYIDLLEESGNYVDARWAFIRPQYVMDKDGNKTPAFRFVRPLKTESNEVVGYDYLQPELIDKGNGNYAVVVPNHSKKNPVPVELPITAIDAANKKYSIMYDGDKLHGYIDYKMRDVNDNYPIFYVYKQSYQNQNRQENSPIILRLAEMYLNMAEAYVKVGDLTNARKYLNLVRERSIPGGGYSEADFNANPAELVNKERQLEMAFEGYRAFDVFRLGQTMIRKYPGPHGAMLEVPASSPLVVQLLPQKEIDAYGDSPLTQNPM